MPLCGSEALCFRRLRRDIKDGRGKKDEGAAEKFSLINIQHPNSSMNKKRNSHFSPMSSHIIRDKVLIKD